MKARQELIQRAYDAAYARTDDDWASGAACPSQRGSPSGTPATEQCNLDDTENDVRIGLDAGWDAVIGGKAKACEHCFPLAGSAGDVR
jgi:hypothetical protein